MAVTSPTIDPGLLTTLLAVADSGSISAASRLLHLSQPAVTAQIQKLEEAVQVPLLVRSVKGVTLTQAGSHLLNYARQISSMLAQATMELRPAQQASGTLVIAASTTIAAHVLPQVLAKFRRLHPQLGIRLEVGNTSQVVAWLSDGVVPLGLVEGHARAAQLRLHPFVEDEIVCVVSQKYPVKIRSIRDLANVPMLWREHGSGTRAVIERALRAHKITRNTAGSDLQFGSTEAIKGAVAAELGVAFLSRWSIQSEVSLGLFRMIPLAPLVIRRAFRWALPAGGVVGVAAMFYDYAKKSPPLLPV